MYKHVVKYTDLDGKPQEKTLYFNLSKAELIKMDLSSKNGLQEDFQRLIDSQDRAKIIETFDGIIDKAYGVKSPDGQRFIKSQEVLDEFKQSGAYDEFFVSLLTEKGMAEAFVRGIVPNTEGIPKAMPNADN